MPLDIPDAGPGGGGSVTARANVSLLMVLARQRWIVLGATLLALVIAAGYLVVATPIFTSSSSLYIEQNGAKILADAQGYAAKSDSFLYTQAEILKSQPILTDALAKLDYRNMRTFAGVDNPVAWLQMGKAFSVEVGKKDDVVTVLLDSPYPQEAAEIVNSVVDAYMTAQGARKKTTAAEMLRVLQREKDNRYAELSEKTKAMLEYKVEHGALSFTADKGNIILERLAKMSDQLANAELETVAVQSEYNTARAALADPLKIRAYVEDLQTRANSGGDKEYEDLRAEQLRFRLAMFTHATIHGENSQMVKTIRANLDGLGAAIAEKERILAHLRVAQLGQDLITARAKEESVRKFFLSQQTAAMELNSRAAEYARLEEEAARTEKQSGDLDNRIKEVTVNSEEAGTLNIQVVEAARAPERAAKPRKALTMMFSMLAGLVIGSGLALVWDWMDQRIRSPEEVSDTLGMSILGVVPQIIGKDKTRAQKGQCVHLESRSVIAEAYRTVRTAVHFGAGPNVKTILVTSPAPGDGKSTTASNLAITLAQAGHKTILIDADLRKPVQHLMYELDGAHGVSDVVLGRKALREVIQPSGVPRLDVLPCGPCPTNPSELISGARFSQVLQALMGGYDRVVIDSPPVMAVTDARLLAANADATVLVLRTNRSTRKGSRLAFEALLGSGARVLGTIVNAMPQHAGVYGTYYGGYGAYAQAYLNEPNADGTPRSGLQVDSDTGDLPDDALLLPRASNNGNVLSPEQTALAA